MNQPQVTLYVIVFKFGVVVLEHQILGDLPVTTRKAEIVQRLVALPEDCSIFAGGNRKAVGFLGSDHPPPEILYDQTRVCSYEYWQIGRENITDG